MNDDRYARALARLRNFEAREFDPSVRELAQLLRALLVERKTRLARCHITGNPCGSDTVAYGAHCHCIPCEADAALRVFAGGSES